MKERVSRAAVEIGFILFLFYANLLMGEYERSGQGHVHGLVWALSDIFTPHNFVVAIVAAAAGHFVVEWLRAARPQADPKRPDASRSAVG